MPHIMAVAVASVGGIAAMKANSRSRLRPGLDEQQRSCRCDAAAGAESYIQWDMQSCKPPIFAKGPHCTKTGEGVPHLALVIFRGTVALTRKFNFSLLKS